MRVPLCCGTPTFCIGPADLLRSIPTDMLRSENALSVSADNAGRDAMVTGVNYGTITKGERTITKCDDCALLNAKDEIIRTKDELIRAKQDTIDAQNVIILSLKQGL